MPRLIPVLLSFTLSLSAQYIINTIAGGGTPDGVSATSVGIGDPRAVIADSQGNVYIASAGQNRIFKVDPAGTLTVVAGNGGGGFAGDGGPATAATLFYPNGISLDKSGSLFVGDTFNCRVRKITDGVIITVAGQDDCRSAGDGLPAVTASLAPAAMATDGNGALYIADLLGGRVRKIADGVITTVAGFGIPGYSLDGGPALSVALGGGLRLAVTGGGVLYIADVDNHRIRKVVDGVMSTVATRAMLQDVAVDANGVLYFADSHVVYRMEDNTITRVAGTGVMQSSGDGGPALEADIVVAAISVDPSGNLYIAGDHRVRKVTNGIINTLAGDGTSGFFGDDAPATAVTLGSPGGVAVDGLGNIYVSDVGNGRVRRMSNGLITTAARYESRFSGGPIGVDAANRVYFIDGFYIRMIENGTTITIAGNGTPDFNQDGIAATDAGMRPVDLAVAASGDVYILDFSNRRIRKISQGVITNVAGDGTCCTSSGDGGPAIMAGFTGPSRIALDVAENLYILDFTSIRKVTNGIITTIATQVPRGASILVDEAGNVYVGGAGGGSIGLVDGPMIAGSDRPGFSGDGGPAAAAAINNPSGMALDKSGNIYIADSGNNRIRMLTSNAGSRPASRPASSP